MTTAQKPQIYQDDLKRDGHENIEVYSATDVQGAVDAESLDINEKALLRKTRVLGSADGGSDLKLVPWLALLYLLSFLDRTNIGNANLFGLSVDLGLSPQQYGACLAVFFGFYVAFEVPSNMVMKAWRPSMWLPIIMIGWGIVMTLMGIVQNYTGLLVARIFLGITEAGLFPGVAFYLTQWYRRYEINFRIALFFSAATAAGAFGGLLARLINFMDGVGGYEGWRWIFILEGIVTVIVAVASFWMLSDYPETTKWLLPNERRFLKDRLLLDRDGTSHEYKNIFIKEAFLDWKVWAGADIQFSVMYMSALTPLYCFSLFSPTLVAALGYTAATAQLMSVPPYAVAAVVTVSVGYLSDRLQRRGLLVAGFSTLSAIGYLMLLVTNKVGVQYAGLFLAASGCYPLIPLIMSWQANCIGGSLKKSISTAIIVSVGNAGGIISSFIFPRTDGPRFIKGHAICMAFEALSAVIAVILVFYFKWANKRKDQAMRERGAEYTPEEKRELADMGDKAPWFKYTE